MAVYSTLLFSGNVTTQPLALYTVPSAATVVVRDIEAFNAGAGSATLFIDRYTSGSLQSIIYAPGSTPANGWVQWRGRAVLNGNDVIELGGSFTSWYLHISGYVLV